jgi:hypothetical protein
MRRSFAKKRLVQLAVIAFLVFLAIPVLVLNGQRGPSSPAIESVTGPADPQALLDQYREWKVIYEKGGGDRNIVMGLSWSKIRVCKARSRCRDCLVGSDRAAGRPGMGSLVDPGQSWRVENCAA